MQGFEFTYNGITINTLAAIQSGNYIAVQRADGFSAPEIAHAQSFIAGNHGIVDSLSYVRGRIITLEGVIRGETEADRLNLEEDFSASFILPDIPRPDNTGYYNLQFAKSGETSKYVSAKIHSLPKFTRALHARCTSNFFVQLRCEDPRIYSVSLQEEDMEKAVLLGGFPSPFPHLFPGGGYSGQKVLTNNGHWSAPLYYRITNTDVVNVVNPVLMNVTQDTFQQFDMELEPGDYIDIDTLNGTAVDQDGNNVLQYETDDSNWLYVHPGANTFRLLSDSGEPEVHMEWRHTWISAPR